MKKLPLLFSIMLIASSNLRADEQTREVQQSLKDQGFYYGQVDGQDGAETSAAIRRFQIRNGLEVTGQINQQTLDALKIGGGQPAQEPSSAQPPPAPSQGAPDLRAPQSQTAESDQEFLQKHSPPGNPTPQNVPPPPVTGAPDYASIFRRTPYEVAPRVVQVDTLKRAQARLQREGFYDGQVDGIPGPATERAIFKYQADADLNPTGLLDMNTLADMNLLPGRGPVRFYPAPPPPPARRVFRGIWIQ